MPGFNLKDTPANLGNVKDAHRAHRWAVSRIVGKTPASLIYTKDLTLPTMGFTVEEVKGASVTYKFPNGTEFGDVTIAFYDVYGLYNELDAMYKKVWTPGGGLRPGNDFMEDTVFGMTDGEGKVIDEWTLKNSWLKELSHSQLSYSDNEIKTVTCTIAYTWPEYENKAVAAAAAAAAKTTARISSFMRGSSK